MLATHTSNSDTWVMGEEQMQAEVALTLQLAPLSHGHREKRSYGLHLSITCTE